jgi:hypothetical protein
MARKNSGSKHSINCLIVSDVLDQESRTVLKRLVAKESGNFDERVSVVVLEEIGDSGQEDSGLGDVRYYREVIGALPNHIDTRAESTRIRDIVEKRLRSFLGQEDVSFDSIRYELLYFTFSPARKLLALSALIDKMNPKRVVYVSRRPDPKSLFTIRAKSIARILSAKHGIRVDARTGPLRSARDFTGSAARLPALVTLQSLVRMKRKVFRSRMKTAGSKVIFLPYCRNHAEISTPVSQHKLLKGRCMNISVDGIHDETADYLKKRKIPFTPAEKFFSAGLILRTLPVFLSLSRSISRLLRPKKQGADDILVGELCPLISFLVTDCKIVREGVRDILKSERPRVLVVMNEANRIGNAAVLAARDMAKDVDCRTLLIQHGIIGDIQGYLPVVSDKVAISGQHARDLFAANGVPKGKLVTTGIPIFDRKVDRRWAGIGRKVRKELGLPNDRTVVAVTLQLDFSKNMDILRIVCESYEKLKGRFSLVVKFHPGFFSKQVITYVRSFVPDAVFVRKMSFSKFVHAVDIVVGVGSTTGLEAFLAGKDVITLDPQGKVYDLDYTKFSASRFVTSSEQLTPALKHLLDSAFSKKRDKAKKKLVEYYCHKVDGGSAARIAELVLQMMSGKEGLARKRQTAR